MIAKNDTRIDLLYGGHRKWWDIQEQKLVPAMTIYLPQGCPDWGAPGGIRNPKRCIFCSGELAVAAFRNEFYNGRVIPPHDHLHLARAVIEKYYQTEHTIFIFNAGSFFAEAANPRWLQENILKMIVELPKVKRVVVDARAAVITEEVIRKACSILHAHNKHLTVRIGIETQDDDLRLHVLRKGHTRKQLHQASDILHKYGAQSGGYILLNPAPGLNPDYARTEALASIDFAFKELKLDEVYYCSANIGPGSPLATAWEKGEYAPANLWGVMWVLKHAAQKYPGRIHMLPFSDEPAFLAVPSNHNERGIPQNLEGAAGCDLAFHQILEHYRQTMDPKVLVPIDCACRPEWF